MLLTWADTSGIAGALAAAYPDADRLSIPESELLRMVRALPGFHDVAQPPTENHLKSILWTWMRLAGSGDGCAGEA